MSEAEGVKCGCKRKSVTIDVIEAGKFTGGLILPGAALMSEALHRHTALLPRVTWRHPVPLVGPGLLLGLVLSDRGGL